MESKFKAMLSKLKPVNTGTKASNDVIPTITVLGIPNKFNLNRLATDLMGLRVGNRVKMFDLDKDGVDNAIDERFFIAKASDTDNTAAKVAASNSAVKSESGVDMAFNYAGIWSCLVQGEQGAIELGYEAMCEKDVVVKGETSGNNVRYRSAYAVKLEVQPVGPAVIEDVEYEMVYVLTNIKRTRKSAEELATEVKVAAPAAAAEEAAAVDPFAEGAEE